MSEFTLLTTVLLKMNVLLKQQKLGNSLLISICILFLADAFKTQNTLIIYFKVAYNDGFRLLLNEPRWCSVSTFDALIRKLIYALWRSCHNSSNVLVDKLLASDIYFESKLFLLLVF